jgi:class 3 adenylate cyclase/alpha-beta hydrolase superfamily lysophospholipase
MTPDVRFCTSSDGARIAYSVSGDGPALLFCPQICEQFSQLHTVVRWQEYIDDVSRGFRRIQYDQRGTGLSERNASKFSIEARLLDLEAVVEAAMIDRFAIYSSLLGGALCIAYAARHPERVSHLVLYGTYASGKEVMPWEQLSGIIDVIRNNWSLGAQLMADMSTRERHADAGLQIADHFRASSSGQAVADGLTQGYEEDVTDLLPQIQAPTLIVHRRDDPVIPFACGQRLAERIPNARFTPLEGKIHAEFLGDSEPVVRAVRSFLIGDEESPTKTRTTAPQVPIVVMFTDIEDSTPLTQRLGDEQAQYLVRTHNAIVREALHAHHGSEVKHTGDGIMASFPSATQALDCGLQMQRSFEEHNRSTELPVVVRFGLNAGEPIVEDEDLFGTAVQAARRICDEAGPGEILVSNVVRELAAGKGFSFDDRGEATLKGFDEPFRLFLVKPA